MDTIALTEKSIYNRLVGYIRPLIVNSSSDLRTLIVAKCALIFIGLRSWQVAVGASDERPPQQCVHTEYVASMDSVRRRSARELDFPSVAATLRL